MPPTSHIHPPLYLEKKKKKKLFGQGKESSKNIQKLFKLLDNR